MDSIVSLVLILTLLALSMCLAILILLVMIIAVMDACKELVKRIDSTYSQWKKRLTKQVRVDVSESATPLPLLLARPIAALIAEEREQYEKFAPARARWRKRLGNGSEVPRVNPKTVISLVAFAFVTALHYWIAVPFNAWVELGIVLFSGGLICTLLTALHLIGEIRSVRAYRQSGGRWWPNEPWSERVAILELVKAFRKDLEDLRTRSNAWVRHNTFPEHLIADDRCQPCLDNVRVIPIMQCLEEDTDRLEHLLQMSEAVAHGYRGSGHVGEIEDLLQRMQRAWETVENTIRPRDASLDTHSQESPRQKDGSQNAEEIAHQERRRSS